MHQTQPLRTRATKGCSYVTRQALPEHGLEAGAPFPYAELGITELHAFNLHRAGVLAVAEPLPPAPPAVQDPVPAVSPATAQVASAAAPAASSRSTHKRR